MKSICPIRHDTRIDQRSKEWIPKDFEGFLSELNHIVTSCESAEAFLFRGHRRREWLLDSTFVRSCKTVLFGLAPEARLANEVASSVELHRVLLNLLLLKYGILDRPPDEIEALAQSNGVDAWFELMKRYQQYCDKDRCHLKGSNLLDWTQSADVALYFANYQRAGEGAVYICDPTVTGKTLQVNSVGEILDKMDEVGNSGSPLGCPLLFCPPKQIRSQRARNQQAIYFAQMDLRFDLETQWRLREQEMGDGTIIIIKLVLPAGSKRVVDQYLMERGITGDFIYPDK